MTTRAPNQLPRLPRAADFGPDPEPLGSRFEAVTRRAIMPAPGPEPLRIRTAVPADHDALIRFFGHLSPESLAFRFFTGCIKTEPAVEAAMEPSVASFVAILDGEIVGHAMAVEIDPSTVEVAFVVADAIQGHGVGTVLLNRIAAACAAKGYTTMVAEVLPGNRHMLDVFKGSAFPFSFAQRGAVVHATAPTGSTTR